MSNVKIESGWKEVLSDEFEKPYFQKIKSFLIAEKEAGKVIYPPGKLIFNAFDSTPFEKVKVVILGQDPYHGPGQAMGLSFSVPAGVKIPASLKNIYKELESDLYITPAQHGDLSYWAGQGVFLLNAMLSVEQNKAGSHKSIGWQHFTDAVIRNLSLQKDGIVFMLWGNFAKSKKALIISDKHYILEAVHPSPLAGGKFAGCRHFSKCNEILESRGLKPIDWKLPD